MLAFSTRKITLVPTVKAGLGLDKSNRMNNPIFPSTDFGNLGNRNDFNSMNSNNDFSNPQVIQDLLRLAFISGKNLGEGLASGNNNPFNNSSDSPLSSLNLANGFSGRNFGGGSNNGFGNNSGNRGNFGNNQNNFNNRNNSGGNQNNRNNFGNNGNNGNNGNKFGNNSQNNQNQNRNNNNQNQNQNRQGGGNQNRRF